MKDHGLDLAVIGNGRTAALVDPCARLVWWCYPRFDGDPVFCRLLAGKQEKGFSDVVLDDMAEFQSEYLRNTAIVCTVLTDQPVSYTHLHLADGQVAHPADIGGAADRLAAQMEAPGCE